MAVSGFLEWSPQIRAVEEKWHKVLSDIYTAHGFCSIETSSVELLKDLETKGEIDKEYPDKSSPSHGYVVKKRICDLVDTSGGGYVSKINRSCNPNCLLKEWELPEFCVGCQP